MAIVVAGEALIDLVLTPSGDLAAHPGGGPYNVARTLGRLGAEVAFVGPISSDAFGARLRAGLVEAGATAAVTTDAPTTLALAELDERGSARYRFYLEGTSAAALAHPPAVAGEVFYAGTLGLVLEPMGTTIERIVAALPAGATFALDPNVRPSALADPDAFRSRLARLLDRADVVKVSEDDLAWLAPGTAPVDAARALLRRDGALGLVTLGGDGAVVVSREDAAEVTAPQVDVVDTIGAGDAFMGAFLAERVRGAAPVEAAEFACRVAARTCARPGADPPRREEL